MGGRESVWAKTTKRDLFGERKEDPKKHRALLRVVDVRDTYCVAEIRGVPPIKKSAPIRQGYKVYSKIPDSAIKFGIRTLFFQELRPSSSPRPSLKRKPSNARPPLVLQKAIRGHS